MSLEPERGEAGQLTGVEHVPPAAAQLPASQLMSGFYANELLLRLLPRKRSAPASLRGVRGAASTRSPHRSADPAGALRIFEKRLLDELGYGLNLETETSTGRAASRRSAATDIAWTAGRSS